MRLPHAIDYYEMGDESFLDLKTKLCVVENIKKSEIIIREIHHFGYKVWLGKRKKISAYTFERLDGKYGPINIITENYQYIVPRCDISTKSAKIALCKKSIYKIKEKEVLKEIVLIDNKPKEVDYVLEEYNSFSDDANGAKGSFYRKIDKTEIMVF